MLCSICQKNDAVMSYTEIVNGVKKEHHICSECASKYTGFGKDHFVIGNSNLLTSLLASVLGQSHVHYNKENLKKTNIVCPNCGMTYNEFLKYSKYGCAECFKTFSLILDPYLKKIQGSCEHTGKLPSHMAETVVLPDLTALRENGLEKTKPSATDDHDVKKTQGINSEEQNTEKQNTESDTVGTAASLTDKSEPESARASGPADDAAATDNQADIAQKNIPPSKIDLLKSELAQAIREEEYEQAASLRDKIRALEKEEASKDEEMV